MAIMDLQPLPQGAKQKNEMRFTLVSELLGTVLVDRDEAILVEAKSQNFLYDQGQCLETGQALEVEIGWKKAEETDQEIELRISGIIKNHLSQEVTFALYFFMWWDYRTCPVSIMTGNLKKETGTKSLTIKAENNKEHLSDTVFELDLYRKSSFGCHQFPGHGRGYLVFGFDS